MLAEFETPEELLEAAERTHDGGLPEDGCVHAHADGRTGGRGGISRTILPAVVFVGGLLGCLGGFSMQYYPNVISYPLNVGGKPHNSWPAFIPITFEMTVLGAALCRGVRDAGDEWTADALSPGFQRAAICAGVARPVFSVHQGARQEIRFGEDEGISGGLNPHGVYEIEA